MKILSRTAIITATIATFAGAAMQAHAQSDTRVVAPSPAALQQKVVSYADLDLQSPEGQQALHYRISKAAEQVCGASDVRRAGSVARAARNAECYEQSISRAMAKISASAVASIN